MKELRFGDFVWYRKEGWQYVGISEDGAIVIIRPQHSTSYDIIDIEYVYVSEPEYDEFAKENGETLSEFCKRKGIDIPRNDKK